MSTEMDFKNWPKRIKDLLPEDLYNAYGNIQKHEVKAKGRKSSIDEDNVNDLSYYYYSQKKDRIDRNIKGTDKTPIQYAYEKSSVKCFCFLYKDCPKYGYTYEKLKKLYDKYKDNEDYKWLKYFCILNANSRMFTSDEIYDFILNSSLPYEDLLIVVNRYREIRATDVLKTRNNKDKEKDIEFYNSLNRNQKIQFLRIVRMEKMQFEIEDAVDNEPDLEINFAYKFSALQVIKHALKYNLIDEFNQFVDDHKNLFENYSNFKMIHPKYRKLYPIAFKDQSWKKFEKAKANDDKLYDLADEISHYIIDKLAPNKCWDEIKYLMQKGYELRYNHIAGILKTLDYQMIDFIKKNVSERDFESAQDDLLIEGHESIEEFFKLGYHPSIIAVGLAIANRKCRFSRNYGLIERFIPSNEKLDPIKRYISKNDIDQLPDFLSKYSDRLESLDIDSYQMSSYHDNYPRLCEILGVEYVKSESEPESSSSYKYKKSKSRSQSKPKTSNRNTTKPYRVCYDCFRNHICVICRKSYSHSNGTNSYVCESHPQKIVSKCPICDKKNVSHIGMICNDCRRNHVILGNRCFKCKL